MRAASEIQSEPSSLRQASWKDYAVRFLFGGVATAVVGIVAKVFGPVVAGLFLAFPAILPASITLLERHEGQDSAAGDSYGAAAGSLGLLAFGATVWALAPRTAAWIVLACATVAWLAVSVGLWILLKSVRQRGRSG